MPPFPPQIRSRLLLHRYYSASPPHRPPTPAAPQRRTLVDLSLVVAAGALISAGLIWGGKQQSSMTDSDLPNSENERPTFTVPVLSQTGAESTKTLALLSPSQVAARLKEHEASFAVTRKSNPVFRYDTAAVASNSPIEDDSCCVILERDASAGNTKGDLMFWGVFDGHSGWQTSRLLSSTLVSYVARELDLVFRRSPIYASLLPTTSPSPSTSSSSSFWSLFSSSKQPSTNSVIPIAELDTSAPIIQLALQNAFKAMDEEILNAPIRVLMNKKAGTSKMEVGKDQTENLNTLLPALSGSCALLAFLDTGRNKLHVACSGDSRAVMGTWEPSTSSGGSGKWRAQILTEDQTGKNPNEVRRIQSEHPVEEKETVVARGRVLGSLEPTRAFGDARYKWPLGMQEKLAEAFHPGSVRGRPKNYLTPPYVTATPVVTTVDLSTGLAPPPGRPTLASFFPVSSSRLDQSTDVVGKAAGGRPKAQRFIVLATDGLYDRLTNEEIVSLVGGHISGLRGSFTRPAVLSHLSPSSSSSSASLSLAHVPRQEPTRGEGDAFVFEDANLATHLVRNALGGAKREQVAALLSIPAPLSRRYRDDITVTVILLGEEGAADASTFGGVRKLEGQDELLLRDVKSKL